MKIISKPINFLKEVKVQLYQVSWPAKDELIGATTVVIVLTFIITVFLGIIDLILSRFLSWVFR